MNYDDIISCKRPVSRRKRMGRMERAAQFAPFAALEGLDGWMAETARETETFREPGEDMRALLDRKLRLLCALGERQPEIWVRYFEPDPLKPGGHYRTAGGRLIGTEAGALILRTGEGTKRIPARFIAGLESGVFPAGW